MMLENETVTVNQNPGASWLTWGESDEGPWGTGLTLPIANNMQFWANFRIWDFLVYLKAPYNGIVFSSVTMTPILQKEKKHKFEETSK